MANTPNGNQQNRIQQVTNRMSLNTTPVQQTPKTSFGDRLQANLNGATQVVANGLGAAAGFVPGMGIVSAAVSGLGGASQPNSPAVSAAYAANGIVNLGAGNGGISTTVGVNPTGANTVTGAVPALAPITSSGVPGNALSQMNNELMSSQAENMKLMQVQIAMQRENQIFTTVSNVLKTRHDTVKNSIANVR